MKWFERAASQGYAGAQYGLARLWEGNDGAPQDFTESRKWYKLAATQGYAEAQFNLGHMHYTGTGGPQDFIEAKYWWEQAAAEGEVKAKSNLGLMYYEGQGGPQDFIQARYWWELAADEGYGHAMEGIGMLYKNGGGVQQDLNEALRWFFKAKAHGVDVTARVEGVMDIRRCQIADWFEAEEKARDFIANGRAQPNTEPSHTGGLDGSATAEERDNYHRDAYENARNHASGPPARCLTTPAFEPRRACLSRTARRAPVEIAPGGPLKR